MGRQIVWSPEAIELLEGILSYWDENNDNKIYSLKLNKLFQECLKQIAKYPKSGTSTNYKNVYCRIVRDYLIYYTYSATRINVVSICDMRRDPEFIKSLLK